MPKVTIYLSDDLYQQARDRNLSLSTLAQEAVERAISRADTDSWVERVRSRQPRHRGRVDTTRLLDEVHGEFGR
jgi:post-segregation antitoxin (ccd killing protein)